MENYSKLSKEELIESLKQEKLISSELRNQLQAVSKSSNIDLKRKLDNYRLLYSDKIPNIGWFSYDIPTQIFFNLSQGLKDILNIGKDTLEFTKFLKKIYDEDVDDILTAFSNLVDNPQELFPELEFRVLTSKGIKWLRYLDVTSNENFDNKIIEGVIQDITVYKQRIEVLENSITKISANNNYFGSAWFRYNIDKAELFFPKDLGILKHIGKRIFTFHDILVLVHQEDRRFVLDRFKKAIEVQSPANIDFRIHIESEDIWVNISFVNFYRTDSNEFIVEGQLHDITSKYHLKMEIENNNSLLESMFKHIPLGMFIVDPENENRIIKANKRFSELFAKPFESIINKTIEVFFDNYQLASKYLSYFDYVLKNKTHITIIDDYHSQNGDIKFYEISIWLLPQSERKPFIILIINDITENHNKELLIVEQNRELKATYHIANMFRWEFFPDNNHIDFDDNAKLTKCFEDFISRDFLLNDANYIEGFSSESLLKAFAISQKTGEPSDIVIGLVNPITGKKFWLSNYVYYLPINKQQRFIGISQDITSRVLDATRIKEIQVAQKVILDSISSGITYLNPEMEVVWVNDIIQETADKSGSNRFDKKKCYEYIYNRDTVCNNCPINEVIATKKIIFAHDITNDNKNHYKVTVVPILDDFGNIKSILASRDNVTALRQRERQALLAKARNEILLEQQRQLTDITFNALKIFDIEAFFNKVLQFLLFNTSAETAYILKVNKQHKFLHVKHFVTSKMQQRNDSNKEFVYNNKPIYMDSSNQGFDIFNPIIINSVDEIEDVAIQDFFKQVKIKSALLVPLYIGQEHYGNLVLDVLSRNTKWGENELVLAKSVANIISLNFELTEKIDSLAEAKEVAEQSERFQSNFLANMSHEIRTPMNSILGFASLIANPTTSRKEISEHIKVINSSGNHLLNIINDVLNISKIDSGQVDFVESDFNLYDAVLDVYRQFEYQSKEKNLSIEIDYSDLQKDIVIKGDLNKLNQVFFNLLSNAIKFTKEGSITIKVELLGDLLQFSIIDTGIGISEDMYQVVFERFRQVELEKNREFGGTGIGLAICEALVKLMGGEINVQSEKDKGSNFYFTIPFYPVTKENSDDITYSDNQIPNFSDKTVLIVEDTDVNYLYISELLNIYDMNVIRAIDGKEAVDTIKEDTLEKIDLILMDIKLPVMNGYEATKLIKKHRPNIPVIAVTAFAMQEDIITSQEAGCDAHISKPVNLTLLLETIENLLP